MGQERLSGLAILSIENERAKMWSLSVVLNCFKFGCCYSGPGSLKRCLLSVVLNPY